MNSSIDFYCLELISHHIKEILYVNTNSKGNQSWNKNKKIYIFTCFWYWCWKRYCFLCGVKIPYQQFLTFFSSINIFRSSRSQMFLKLVALKNFAIFWIKKSLQHRSFLVNIAKFLRTAFLQNLSGGCFYITLKVCTILKAIKQLFCKGYFYKNILVMMS